MRNREGGTTLWPAQAQTVRLKRLWLDLQFNRLGGQFATATFAERFQLPTSRFEVLRRAFDGKNDEWPIAVNIRRGKLLAEAVSRNGDLEDQGREESGVANVGRGQLRVAR